MVHPKGLLETIMRTEFIIALITLVFLGLIVFVVVANQASTIPPVILAALTNALTLILGFFFGKRSG
jgi:Na+-transporting NADH:ubiquinone oxidoreductase subunit NqrE